MAYDANRDRVVLFGGAVGGSRLQDTWEWDGAAWTQLTPAIPPPARSEHALAFDAGRGRVVMFGGDGPSNALEDTWEWDGTTWTQATPATSPPARLGHTLAYDPIRDRVVLFGGAGTTSGAPTFGDTWEWDGTTWTQLTPATAPAPRYHHAMVYFAGRSRMLLFGGTTGFLGTQGDTWEWDGTTWT